MLDIKLFRERPEELSKALAARYGVFPVEEVVGLDARRREVLTLTDDLRSERNQGSREIAELRKSGGDAAGLTERMRLVGGRSGKMTEMISDMGEPHPALSSRYQNPPQIGPGWGGRRFPTRWSHLGRPRKFRLEPLPIWELGNVGIIGFRREVRL